MQEGVRRKERRGGGSDEEKGAIRRKERVRMRKKKELKEKMRKLPGDASWTTSVLFLHLL